jgi:hypothetical protein
LLQWPLMRPRDRTPYAVSPIPNSRRVGRISFSMPREISDYSIYRSAMGCVACALRIVCADTSDKPM